MTSSLPSTPGDVIRAGFIPLLDSSPLIVAGRMGFAEAEGLRLMLVRETSWATLRDRMAVRHLDVAHMLAPMPIADNLGLNPLPGKLIAPMALGFGGNTITVSLPLWEELADQGASAEFEAASIARAFATVVARRKAKGQSRVTLGIVHSHSAHHYQLAYWLRSAGILPGRDVDFVVVPPSLSSAALASAQVDGFCAGEPWGSAAVAEGVGCTILTNAHIWRRSPEKVLSVRQGWAEENPERLMRLLRAVYRAARWCDEPDNRPKLASLLSGEDIIGLPEHIIRPGLERRLRTPSGNTRDVPGLLTFAEHAATFPWISHALWMLSQMVRWRQVQLTPEAVAIARRTYRPDLYRAALASLAVVLPSANSKVEGALAQETPAASPDGKLTLGSDAFFDGRVFDPDRIEDYIAALSSEPN
jgi:NitT/TauT family transport system ATP-binding protein